MSGLGVIDKKLGCEVSIDESHHLVHAKKMFILGQIWTTVADGGDYGIFINATSTTELHSVFNIVAGGDVEAHILKSVTNAGTITAGGAVELFKNYELNTCTTDTKFYLVNTASAATGTVVTKVYIPGGTLAPGVKSTPGGTTRPGSEIIFEDDLYLLRFINTSGGVIKIGFNMESYELSD